MAANRRTIGAFALSALLTAAAAVYGTSGRSHSGTDAEVNAAHDDRGRASGLAVMDAAIARAHALTGISARTSESGSTVLDLRLEGEPRYELTRSDDGLTHTLDLHGTVIAGAEAPADIPGAARIETALAAVEPNFISRVTIVRTDGAVPALTKTEAGLEIAWNGASDAETAADARIEEARRAANRAAIALAQYDEAAKRLADRFTAERTLLDDELAQSPAADTVFTELASEIDGRWTAIRTGAETELADLDARIAAMATSATSGDSAAADAERLRKSIHTQWALFAQSADAAFVTAAANVQSAVEPVMTLAALDAGLRAERAASGLAVTSPENELSVIGRSLGGAVTGAAQSARTVASNVASAVTIALARAQMDLQQASQLQAAEQAVSGGMLTLTNDDVRAFAQANDIDSIITRSRPTAMATVGEGTSFVLPVMRPVFAAQADEGAAPAGDSGASAPAAPPASAPAPVEAASAPTATTIPVIRGADLQGGADTVTFDPNDPMNQLVDIDFRDMELSNAVAILARKAGVNVVAGPPLTGTITASLKGVPLRKAMEILLQLNDLGMIEDDNILRIVTFEEAIATHRVTRIVYLDNAKAGDLANTLQGTVAGGLNSDLLSVTANDTTNVILISGPPGRVQEIAALAQELDVAEPVLPTYTEAIPLNYADPAEILPVVTSLLTAEVGKAESDPRSRHVIVNDVPAVIEEVKRLLLSIDQPVKQVAINALVVDVVLRDGSEIGTNWLFEMLPDFNTRGLQVGDFSGGSVDANLGNIGTDSLNAGILSFGLANKDYNLQASIAAEVASSNAKILANPSIITAENKEANIIIAQEFPYQEFRQGLEGPPVASTEFKDIGITLNVMPRVTHDNHIIVDIDAKQSSISGITDSGIPIEDKREATTSLTAADGQSIFIGGLRNISDRLDTSKIPVLGDIPVLNFMFKNTGTEKINTELMIFMTCHVISGDLPELTPAEQAAHDEIGSVPYTPDAQRAMFRHIGKPGEMRDPAWKWRRTK